MAQSNDARPLLTRSILIPTGKVLATAEKTKPLEHQTPVLRSGHLSFFGTDTKTAVLTTPPFFFIR